MEKRTREQKYTKEDFEAKAQEVIHMVLTMSEDRIMANSQLDTPAEKALPEIAMTVSSALRAFLAILYLQDK